MPHRRRHHAGIVQQQVDRLAVCQHRVGELPHAGEVRQIHPPHLDVGMRMLGADLPHRLLTLGDGAHRQDDAGPCARELPRRLLPSAAVRARHDRALTPLIRNLIGHTHSL